MTIPVIHKHDPAFTVIERLGGKATVAAELGLDKSALTRWCKALPDGTGGVIPQRHWAKLMAMSRRMGVDISLQELAATEV